ncbi:MAG TPA: ribbon-helix-helix protein, CopG family [archaeon]|nr:ribbon-helix-helix protein, CopG family [archaeon]
MGVSQMANQGKENTRPKMVNITINLPHIYDKNIQKLIKMKVTASRSEAIRTALRDFLYKEYKNLELFGFFDEKVD